MLAVLLMIGFYFLAIGIAAVLLYLPYAEWRYLGRVEIKLAFIAVAAAFAILAAVIPRADKFEPPGPSLEPAKNPRLAGLITQIATATGQTAPKHVYLVPDLNAWVAQRGGIMGFGSERVMGVGLPLLQTLTVSEFSAVLAHEFGHFHGGDTMLGPWVYKTREAIGRTLSALSTKHTWLSKPFEWYGTLFLRITHAVSRQQEFAADALAARVVGAPALATGLKAIHSHAPLFPGYWHSEVAPAIRAGYRPPIASGFGEFLRAPSIAPEVSSLLEKQLAEASADPLDTHPPLSERLGALGWKEKVAPAMSEPPAIDLLEHPEREEERLLAFLLPPDVSTALKPAAWADMGELVLLPMWRELVAKHGARLTALRFEDLPSLASPAGALAVHMRLAASPSVATASHIAEAQYLVGAAVALSLYDRGFRFTAQPGEAVTFTVGPQTCHPFSLMAAFLDKSITLEGWQSLLQAAQIDSIATLVPAP